MDCSYAGEIVKSTILPLSATSIHLSLILSLNWEKNLLHRPNVY
jgi:hypothetical protein